VLFRLTSGFLATARLPGRPGLVGPLYHGTVYAFDEFRLPEDTGMGHTGLGIHFGTSQQAGARAMGYFGKEEEGASIHPVYLNIKKPLRMRDLYNWGPVAVSNELYLDHIISLDQHRHILALGYGPRKYAEAYSLLRQWLDGAGHDAIVYRNRTEGPGDSYIVWHTGQIAPALSKTARLPKRPGLVGPVYHGTRSGFDRFSLPEELSDEGDLGIHLGNLGQAEHRALYDWDLSEGDVLTAEPGANVRPVYLDVKKPLRMYDAVVWTPRRVALGLFERGLMTRDEMQKFTRSRVVPTKEWYRSSYRLLRKWIEDRGYDSVVYRNEHEGGGDSYIVWHTGQIIPALEKEQA
jgi:hypothetical protein